MVIRRLKCRFLLRYASPWRLSNTVDRYGIVIVVQNACLQEVLSLEELGINSWLTQCYIHSPPKER